jgi:geranylgeranylglycerol-phosphate geranylgeranyltransferase
MKLCIYFFCIANFFVFVNSLISPILPNTHILYDKRVEKSIFPNHPIKPSKIESITKLTRINNVLPTMLLCFSGGWIANPSFVGLITSKTFIVSTVNTLGVMITSMIVNDIFDLEVDKYNNPTRPLVTGEIKVREAVAYSAGILCLIEYISHLYLPGKIQYYLQLALLNILLYTPYLKKITLLKNISCAFLISFSIYFSGLSANLGKIQNNTHLLAIAARTIFLGSLMNELLLDIRDRDGDALHNIMTVPVKYGNEKTWWFVFAILLTNVGWNSAHVFKYYGFVKSLLFAALCSPFFMGLFKIKKHHYSKSAIYYTLNEFSKYLFLVLIYLCSLVKK